MIDKKVNFLQIVEKNAFLPILLVFWKPYVIRVSWRWVLWNFPSREKTVEKNNFLHIRLPGPMIPGMSCFRVLGSPVRLLALKYSAGLRREWAHHQIGCALRCRFCGRIRVGLRVSLVSPSICHLGIRSMKRSSRSRRGSLCLFLVHRWSS